MDHFYEIMVMEIGHALCNVYFYIQPLNQLDPGSPYCLPFQTPVQSQPHSPLRIMANVNANQPPVEIIDQCYVQ